MLARVWNQYANLKSLIRIENLSRAKFMRNTAVWYFQPFLDFLCEK